MEKVLAALSPASFLTKQALFSLLQDQALAKHRKCFPHSSVFLLLDAHEKNVRFLYHLSLLDPTKAGQDQFAAIRAQSHAFSLDKKSLMNLYLYKRLAEMPILSLNIDIAFHSPLLRQTGSLQQISCHTILHLHPVLLFALSLFFFSQEVLFPLPLFLFCDWTSLPARHGDHTMSLRPDERVPIHPFPSSHARPRIHLLKYVTLLFFLLLLLSNVLNNWPTTVAHAAATTTTASRSKVTLTQAVQQTTTDLRFTTGPFIRPTSIPAVPTSTAQTSSAAVTTTTTTKKALPSAAPATMKAASFALDRSFLVGTATAPATKAATQAKRAATALSLTPAAISAGSAPLTFTGSDGRLQVQVPRGSLDLTHATIDGGTAPVGALSLQISQLHGYSSAERVLLGTYVLQVVDSQSHVVHGIILRRPATIRYHYTRADLLAFGLDPAYLLLSQPDGLAAARAAKQSTSPYTTAMTNTAATQTVSAQVTVLAGALDVSGEPELQTPAKPDLASVEGNSGQLSYSYPLDVAPGADGFEPSLNLSYSSESTNERYSRRAPADDVGDGWDLSLGSISMETYPSTSTSAGTWYFLSGVAIGGGVSDRLVQSAVGADGRIYFDTEHITALRIMYASGCFHIWDRSGYYYELGCTSDSKQYTTDSSGTVSYYRYDLDEVLAPYNSTSQVKAMLISYLQDKTTSGSYTTVRDAVIKQITYGYATTVVDPTLTLVDGTVDFHYHAPSVPSGASSFVTAYGNNYNCNSTPPATTTLRCDDPVTYNSVSSPDVMSTFSLDSVTSYVGDDSSSSHKDTSYAFTYQDIPYTTSYYDPYTSVQQAGSGDHLLRQVTPTIYQNGTAHVRKPILFLYSTNLQDTYTDASQKVEDGSEQYGGQTFWHYLTQYDDLTTGVGENITYGTAYANTNGTPYITDSSDNVTDDRHDPLFCTNHASLCVGSYATPAAYAWSVQVVTQIQNRGADSTDSTIATPTTTYNYWLASVSSNAGKVSCNPITASGTPTTPKQTDCVGDNWVPGYNGTTDQQGADWADYYHAEFRGFNGVFITSPEGNLTTDYYFSTEGWNTPESDGGNYNRGELYEEDVYWGNQASSGSLLQQTKNYYSGVSGPFSTINSCNGDLNPTYNPCILEVLRSKTIEPESMGDVTDAPWVQQDYTYDDVSTSTGFIYGSTYHNLLQEVTSSSNAPTVTNKWTYEVDDQQVNGIQYYNVDKVIHSEVDDASGHVWQCENTTYDEGEPSGVPHPAAGLVTTTTDYSDCSNQSATLLKSYTGYDQYGNPVASVDSFGSANSSLYSSSGCTLSTAPVTLVTTWTAGRYSNCETYDSYGAQAASEQNVAGQTSSSTYDETQGALPSSSQDVNQQTTSLNYSYPASNTAVVQESDPGESNGYTSQSTEKSTCTSSSTLPCYEIDTNSSLYPNAVTQTFYDSQGRAVETREPLDASDDLISYTLYDEVGMKYFKSVPFRYPHSVSGWVDPATVTIDDNGQSIPAFTMYRYDPLGRVISTEDPTYFDGSEAGVTCDYESGTWSSCTEYNYYQPDGSSTEYAMVESIDADNQATMTFTDALGRTRYEEWFSDRGSVDSFPSNSDLSKLKETQYNALSDPTAVIVTDEAPQAGQSISSVTATATYNDLGQETSVTDPDTGTQTYTYDADGRQIETVSGTRTMGTSYDLLGRVGCVQDAAPTTNGSGACSSGSHPLEQNTYDSSTLGTAGSSDFPIGELTQSIATTYYPDGSDATVTEQYQHDQRGQTTAETLQVGLPNSWNVTNTLPTYEETQTYNDDGQPAMTQTTVGGQTGYTFSQAYDSTTGTLVGLSNDANGAPTLASQSYNQNGQVSAISFLSSSGTALADDQFTYDDDLRPVSDTASGQSGSGTTGTIFSDARTYDAIGNVTSVTTTQAAVPGQSNSGGSETENFCYDAQNRLVWAGNEGSEPAAGTGTCGSATLANSLQGAGYSNTYAYTNLGQLWQAPLNGSGSAQQYLYCDSTHPHQLTGVYPAGTTCATVGDVTASYSTGYDSWGNAISRTYASKTATLSYDDLDQLVQYATSDTSQQWYAYDASGERVVQRSTLANGTPLTIYAFGLEEHYYDAAGQNTDNISYYTLDGHLIGSLEGTQTSFFATDALGSVMARISNTAGAAAILGNTVYTPYGTQSYLSGSLSTNRGFTGQYQDDTGLDYYGARYYDPVIGRFLSADDIQGNGQGADPYAYVQGNPETFTDPTGESGCNPDTCSLRYLYQPVRPSPPRPRVVLPFWLWSWTSFFARILQATVNVTRHTNTTTVHRVASAVVAANVAKATHTGTATGTIHRKMSSNPANDEQSSCQSPGGGQAICSNINGLYAGYTPWGILAIPGNVCLTCIDTGGGESKGEEESNDPGYNDGCSFTPQTVVATDKGKQTIGTAYPGEQVWAYNPKTKKMELQPIVHVWVHADADLVDLTITTTHPAQHDKSATTTNEVVHTNKKHPFLTVEKGFLPVGQITLGMHVVEADGAVGVITRWQVVPGTVVMYNLEVAQDHTFTVGAGQWVVHNCEVGGREDNPLAGATYTDKVDNQKNLRQIKLSPNEFHGFPDIVDNYGALGETKTITGGDGITRTRLQIHGWYGGKEGVFEYIIERDGATVNHRVFLPYR